jgi:Abnormal spindle-like microcephaly-assoc'd, ASPM-SPD-2-Hydin
MRVERGRKQADSFTFSGRSRKVTSAGRLAALAVTLSAWLFTAGCIGVTGSPNSSGTSGGTGNSGGAQSAQLSPSSTQVNFGNVNVGSSTSQLVTVTAAGTANVTISSVAASGAGFSVSGGSNVVLAPNQSVTLSIGFQPGAAGAATGKLLISSNAANSTLQIALSGSGVAASGSHSVALNWQASTSPVTGYFVFRGPSSSNLSQLNATAVPTTSYTDHNVVNGQTYVYAVKSIDSSNVLSNFSNPVTVTIPNQ